MMYDPDTLTKYGPEDIEAANEPEEGFGPHGGYIADEAEGALLGLAYVRFRAGAYFPFVWPYDEVCVVTRGSLRVRTDAGVVTTGAGEVMNQPRGVAGVFDIEEDLEMLCVHYPTFAKAHGITLAEYDAMAREGVEVDLREPPRGSEFAGGRFDPTTIQTLTLADVPTWERVSDGVDAWIGHLVNRAEEYPLGLAFWDIRAGATQVLTPSTDGVATVTTGALHVSGQGREFTVFPGEVLSMPRDVAATIEALDDSVVVGIPLLAEEDRGRPAHST